MVFFIFAILAFLLLFVFKTYRTIHAVVISIVFLICVTSVVLGWGLHIFSQGGPLSFFTTQIGAREFYHLISFWYAADILCAVLIIRNYRAYRSINSGNPPPSGTQDATG